MVRAGIAEEDGEVTVRASSRRNGRTAPQRPTVRVAVYTRKSVTEGLDQEFNSLDAQREAVEAYVASQRGEGWEALPERYDDGGYTGANTARPAFQRLLEDVEAGKVDAVGVYKLDRLSRSLLDFAHLMEVFQTCGVAFVSVTEHFETSSPMGRMVLNMLATFAQFERETIAQRTRDKMLAARRKGMWTGGRPVLGYDVEDKRLTVNKEEAERVRAVYELYLDLGSLLPVVDELKRRRWKTKTWTNKKGDLVRGRPFTKTSLHHMLTNPLYTGKVRCGEELYDGAHEAIVTAETWDAVQAQLAANVVGSDQRPRTPKPNGALLQGLAHCACGAALTHHYTKRGSRRYAYYVCTRQQKEGAAACPGSRVAVGELESFVLDQIQAIGRDPAVLEATLEADRKDREERKPELVAEVRSLRNERSQLETERGNLLDAIVKGDRAAPAVARRLGEGDDELRAVERRQAEVRAEVAALDTGSIDPEELREALADLEPIWAELFPAERARILALLLERVEYDAAAGEVEIVFRPGGPKALTAEKEDDQ